MHALLSFKSKLDVRRSDYFDVQGAHCNVQAARDVKATREYVKKDGDFIEDWNAPEAVGWSELLDKSFSKSEFMDKCRELKTRDFVLNHEKLEYFADKHFAETKPKYASRPLDSFNLPIQLDDWVYGNLMV